MQSSTFSGCCAARIIYGFGGGHNWQEQDQCSSRLVILEWVIARLKEWKREGIATVFAAPTSTQDNAVKALQELGIYHNDEGATGSYSSAHKIYPMYFCMNEYDGELIKELEKEIKASKPAKNANPFK